jgi:hypothetical protein
MQHNENKKQANHLKQVEAEQAFFAELAHWSPIPESQILSDLFYLYHNALEEGVAPEAVTGSMPVFHAFLAYFKVKNE